MIRNQKKSALISYFLGTKPVLFQSKSALKRRLSALTFMFWKFNIHLCSELNQTCSEIFKYRIIRCIIIMINYDSKLIKAELLLDFNQKCVECVCLSCVHFSRLWILWLCNSHRQCPGCQLLDLSASILNGALIWGFDICFGLNFLIQTTNQKAVHDLNLILHRCWY